MRSGERDRRWRGETMNTSIMAFAAGAALFFGAHLFSAFRARGAGDIKQRMGGAYMGLYSLVSIAGLALIVWGYGGWRYAGPELNPVLWSPPAWTRHIALSLMLPSLILLVAANVPAGWIKKAVKHPMLLAIKIWAFAHLCANGDLASIVLFGSFLAYAVIDRIAVNRRDPVVVESPQLMGDLIAVLLGAGLYAGIAFWAHPALFGVAVIG
jgi:uncharacterized membrane protein